MTKGSEIKSIVYPLVDRAITNGDLIGLLKNVIKLDDEYIKKMNHLVDDVLLEDIIYFSEEVTQKQKQIEFIEQIAYSEISKNILERKELHKYLEEKLWIFGEQYLENTRLLSDKNLEKNLKKLRDENLIYEVDKKIDNEEKVDDQVRLITDLFIYSEKPINVDRREVLIIELKAPRVKISKKELQQVIDYAVSIEESPHFSEKIDYKIILISSAINKSAQTHLKGASKNVPNNPHYYWSNENRNITVEAMKWSELIETTTRRLSYLSNKVKTKDKSIQNNLETEFAEIEKGKLKSSLTRSRRSKVEKLGSEIILTPFLPPLK